MTFLYCNVNDTVINRDHILILTLQYLECYKLKQQKAITGWHRALKSISVKVKVSRRRYQSCYSRSMINCRR